MGFLSSREWREPFAVEHRKGIHLDQCGNRLVGKISTGKPWVLAIQKRWLNQIIWVSGLVHKSPSWVYGSTCGGFPKWWYPFCSLNGLFHDCFPIQKWMISAYTFFGPPRWDRDKCWWRSVFGAEIYLTLLKIQFIIDRKFIDICVYTRNTNQPKLPGVSRESIWNGPLSFGPDLFARWPPVYSLQLRYGCGWIPWFMVMSAFDYDPPWLVNLCWARKFWQFQKR